MDIEALLKTLIIEEKVALVAGTDFMYTNPVPRLDIPSIRLSNGPHGLRIQQEKGDNGTSNSEIATCFPTAVYCHLISKKGFLFVGKQFKRIKTF